MLRLKAVHHRAMDSELMHVDLAKLVSHFSIHNKTEGKSPKTVSWYTEMISGFIRWCNQNERSATLADLDIHTVRVFIVDLQQRRLSPFTVQGYVRALRAFCSWLHRDGYTSENLLANLKPPKVPRTLVQPLSPDEIEQLLASEDPLSPSGSRNIAILIMLLDTGARCAEISNLKLEDVHFQEGYMKIMGKGSKERMIPIGLTAQKALLRYVYHYRPQPLLPEHENLFLTLDGEPLTTNAIKLLLKRWGHRAGVPRLHSHLIRHTFATNFLTYECGDVFMLQQILGHSSLEMVRRYVHYVSADGAFRNRARSPLDRMHPKRLRGHRMDRQPRISSSGRK